MVAEWKRKGVALVLSRAPDSDNSDITLVAAKMALSKFGGLFVDGQQTSIVDMKQSGGIVCEIRL